MPEETIDNSQEQAVFTELFDVQVTDGTEFELGLQRLTEAYQTWRKGLSEDDKGVLGAGIALGIEKASNQVETFADQMTTTLARLANTMDQIAGKVGTAFEQGLGKAAENIKTEVESTADLIEQLEKRAKDVAAEESGNLNSRRRDVFDQEQNDQAQRLRADERAQASRDRIQDRKERRDVIADFSPEARASVEPHRTPQQDVARDFASSTRGQVDAFQEKTVATLDKLTLADERERIASATSLEEKLALLKEVIAELDILNAKLAQGPPTHGNLYSDITPGTGGEDIVELEAKEREAAALDAFNKDKARAQDLQKYKRTLETGITRDESKQADRRPDEIPTQKVLLAQDAAQREIERKQREADREAASAANRRPDEVATQKRLAAQDAADRTEEGRKKDIADQLERINKLTADNIELIERAKAGQGPSRADQVKSLQDEIARLQGKLGSNSSEVAGLQSTPGPLTRDDEEQRQLRVNEVLKDTANIKRQIATTERSLNRAQDLTKDISLQEQSNTATRQMLDLESKLAVARDRLQNGDRPTRSLLIESLERQVAEYEKTVERAEQEVKRLAALRPAPGAPNTEANLTAIKNYKAAVGEATAATNRLASANAELNTAKLGFFGNLRDEMGSALETAVKFSIAYKLVFEALELAGKVILAPFKALREGIEYLTDLQNKTADLSAVISQNVAYSKDQGENFAIAQKIGVQAMQALQSKAIEARVPIENLTRTFKALLEAKAIGLVGNMNELISLATQMQGVVEHMAPKGQFGGGEFEKGIADLFNGNSEQSNLFLKTTQITVTQWEAMVERAKTMHDLLSQLAPSLRPLLDATGKAQLNFSVMKEQFELLLHRMEAFGASSLFEYLSNRLVEINQWLEKNSASIGSILEGFGTFSAAIVDVVVQVIKLGVALKGVDVIAGALGAVLVPVTAGFLGIAELIDMMVTGLKEAVAWAKILGSGTLAQAQDTTNQLESEHAKRSDERGQILKNSAAIFSPPKQEDSQTTTPTTVKQPAPAEAILPAASPEIRQEIIQAATKYGVDTGLALSVAQTESKGQQFDKSGQLTTSQVGAQGVMQLMPATAKDLKVDATDAKQNIDGGVRYLAQLITKYKDPSLALMAYNWGPGNVDKVLAAKGSKVVPQDVQNYASTIVGRTEQTVATTGPKTLNSPAEAKGDIIDPKANVEQVRRDLEKAKSQYESDIASVKRAKDDAREQVAELVADGKLSQREAARQIAGIAKEELAALEPYIENVRTALAKAITSISGMDINKKTKTALLTELTSQQTQLESNIARAQDQADKATHRANLQADRERVKEAEEVAAQRFRVLKQSTEDERALVQESTREGRLTTPQAYEADTEIDRVAHANRLQEFQTELDRKRVTDGEQTESYQKTLHAMDLEEQAWSAKLELYGRQRFQVAHEQELQRQRDAAQLREANLGSLGASVAVDKSVSQGPNDFTPEQNALLQARRSALAIQTQEVAGELAIARARNDESERTAQLRIELEGLHEARVRLLQDEINEKTAGTDNPVFKRQITQKIVRDSQTRGTSELNSTTAQIPAVQSQLDSTNANIELNRGFGLDTSGLEAQADKLTAQLGGLTGNLDKINQHMADVRDVADSVQQKWSDFGDTVMDDLLGPKFKAAWEGAEGTLAKAQTIAAAVPNLIGSITQEVGIFKQGRERDGVAGGIGALLSQGPLSDILSQIPIVGAFVKPVGEMITMIEDAFRSGARHIAQEVKKQFDQTTKDISSGQLGLGQGLAQVNGEINEAITRLTDKAQEGIAGLPTLAKVALNVFSPITALFDNNGAIDELNKILPPMVEEMEQLLRQQAQVFTEFNNQLKQLQLQSETLGQINTQWQGINQEVAKYLDAGGDAVKANQMLALGLQDIVRQSGAELTQGYDQAVQDAIQLNSLALQRYNLQQQFKQQEFSLVNADSIERMQAGAVTRGQQLTQLRTQYQQQLDDLNSQISLEAKKVTAERQIFDIATSISDLHRQDEALQLASLQMQLQKYKDLQNAVGTITSGAATPGTGNADLSSQLSTIDAQIAKYSIALKTDQSKEDGQNQSANDAAYLMQLVQTQKTLASQLSESAGGSLAGTGLQGEYLNAIEAAQAALNNQATYASSNAGASPWYRDVGGYITSLTSAAAGLAQNQQGILSGGNATPIGVNPAAYSPSQLNLSGLQGLLNTGLSQNNTISVTVNVPAGTSTTGVGPVVADSITQALASRSRQSIIG